MISELSSVILSVLRELAMVLKTCWSMKTLEQNIMRQNKKLYSYNWLLISAVSSHVFEDPCLFPSTFIFLLYILVCEKTTILTKYKYG